MDDLTYLEKLAEHPATFERHLEQAVETAMTVVTTYGLKMIGAIIILVVGWTVSGFVRDAIIKAGRRAPKVDVTIFTFIASMAKYIVLIFTLVAMLSSFGVETTSFVAVLGAMGLAVGLALQGALGHVASGFMLILFRPFRVGDNVQAAGVEGVVTEISLFTTEICTADNVMIIIPNSLVWAGTIKNLSSHEKRRLVIEVGISYSADIEGAMSVIDGLLADDPRVQKEPHPVIGVSKLGDAAVSLSVEVWVPTEHLQNAKYDLNKRIKEAFDKKGIQGPMASRQIYVASNQGSAPKPTMDRGDQRP